MRADQCCDAAYVAWQDCDCWAAPIKRVWNPHGLVHLLVADCLTQELDALHAAANMYCTMACVQHRQRAC
eukprot:2927305-Pleurochrysis_carterae.AAC.1